MQEGRSNPYIHDIFYGKGNAFKDHLAILNEILSHLLDEGMQVNLDKSMLCAIEVKFLGFCLGQKGFKPTKIEAILKLALQSIIKKTQGFLRTINFIKNYIPNQATIMEPITRLTK